MRSIIIGIFVGILTTFGLKELCDFSILWSIVLGVLSFFSIMISTGLLLHRKLMRINGEIQYIMEEGQAFIQRKIQKFQTKPVGGMKTMQKIIEKEQSKIMEQALLETDKLEKYCPWSIMLEKQLMTMRMQFNFQLKNFDAVDKLIPKAIYMDSLTVAMKMVREYVLESPNLEKTYAKYSKKLKADDAVLVFSAYAWMLIKRKKYDEALTVLVDGKKRTNSEIIIKNWESVANGKYKQFSNADLGDMWYSLHLEEPKQPKQRQKRMRKNVF